MASNGKVSFRALMVLASLVWLGLCIVLVLYWSKMPAYLAWPLAILAAALATDARMIKIALGIENIDDKQSKKNGD